MQTKLPNFSFLTTTFLVTCLLASPAFATIISLTATDTGFVTETGGTDKFDATVVADAKGNYSVGYEVACPGGGLCAGGFIPMQRKNFFTFDFSGIGVPIIGASLKLFNPIGGYESPTDPPSAPNETETYVIGATDPAKVPGVLTKISAIGTVGVPADVTPALIGDAVELFGDLGESLGAAGDPVFGVPVPAGLTIAEVSLAKASEGSVVDVVFNPAGIGYLNDILLLGLDLVLGGAVSTADPLEGPTPQSLFGFTGVSSISTSPVSLELTLADVPEPSVFLLLTTGLGVLVLCSGIARHTSILCST